MVMVPAAGIYSSSGNVSVIDSTISGNNSYGGGGITTGSGSVYLNNSTVSENSSRSFDGGGAISTVSGNVSVTNSTISGNSNIDIGGGISTALGNVSVVNSTIVGNSGGGVSITDDNMNSSLRIVNSIVAGNFENSSSSTPLDLVPSGGDVLRIDRSLIGVGDNLGTITGNVGNLIGSQASPLDPLLGPLADNGGPTLTHALLPGSPAIGAGDDALAVGDSGSPLTTDQTGGNRFVSTVDLGAVESEFADPFLLGDANLDGVVNFLDISPFISLLANNTFLAEADVNRDGSVNFLDISPFISLLASSSPAEGGQSDGGSAESMVGSGTAAESEAVNEEAPMTMVVLDSASKPEPITSVAMTAEMSLVFIGPLATSEAEVSELASVDENGVGVTPHDTYSRPVASALVTDRYLEDRSSSLRSDESSDLLGARQFSRGAQERLGFARELGEASLSTSVPNEITFSTAAELFDAHPESLDEVFDFQLEGDLAGLID